MCLKIKVNLCRVPFLDLFFIFSLKKSTGNSQGLIHLANNSVSRAMYKERKQIMSTSPAGIFCRLQVEISL